MVIALLFPSLHLLANNIKWPKIDQQLLEFHSKGLICERSEHHIEIKEIGILKVGENRGYRTNISKWDIFSEFQTCYLPILNEKQPQMETPSGRSLLHNLKVFLDPLRLLAKMKTNGGSKDFCKKPFLSSCFLFFFCIFRAHKCFLFIRDWSCNQEFCEFSRKKRNTPHHLFLQKFKRLTKLKGVA